MSSDNGVRFKHSLSNPGYRNIGAVLVGWSGIGAYMAGGAATVLFGRLDA
jgi:putative hemolysin